MFRTAENGEVRACTYFFNGGVETPYPGEERCWCRRKRSPPTTDAGMSAPGVTDVLCKAIEAGHHDFVLCNYANGDMVGHRGTKRAVKAVERWINVSACRQERRAARRHPALTAATATASCMIDPMTDGPHTAHTTNPVRSCCGRRGARAAAHGGALRDVRPHGAPDCSISNLRRK